MCPQIIHVDWLLLASDKLLKLFGIKHPEPLWVDEVREAVKEGSGLGGDLAVELVFAYELDVWLSALYSMRGV